MFAMRFTSFRACATVLKSIIPATPLRAFLHTTPVRQEARSPRKFFVHQKPAFVPPHTPRISSRPVANALTERPFVWVDDPFCPPTLVNARSILKQNQLDMCILNKSHVTLKKHSKGRKFPLSGRPQSKGVVLKTLIKKPKKPNSANRRCVRVRLTGGKEYIAHVPGEGHNLQEHSIVLVRNGRTQDLVGVKLKVIRGKYDCAPVKKRTE